MSLLTNIFNCSKYVLHFWKLLAYACQIEILDTLDCSMFTLKVEPVPPLDTFLRHMPSTMIMIYTFLWTFGLG